jgi:CBS domain-containing membrane protein
MHKRDLLIAPAGEAFLILVAALAGWLARQPLIFASLGPTAYELIETPHRRSARPYSIFVGHLTGVAAAWLAIFATHAWGVHPVSAAGVPYLRIWAAAVAAAITVFGTLLLRASQPAAISTTLLIATGIMQTPREVAIIMAAVVLMILCGEPLRRWRLNEQKKRGETRDERG